MDNHRDNPRPNREQARYRARIAAIAEVIEARNRARARAARNPVNEPPRHAETSSDSEDFSDSDSSIGSFNDEEDEEEDWEQDWDSDSQEYRRPLSGSDNLESSSSSSDSEDNSIIVLDDTLPVNSNNIQDQVEVDNTTLRDMPTQTSSNTPDHDDTPTRIKRPRVESVAENQEAAASVTADDENVDDSCTICYEEYTSSGEHRLVSLKCGHFFGKNCIERWIRSEGRGASCPNCKRKTHSKDVRMHFTKTVKMVDNSALEDLKAKKLELERKNDGLQMELAKTKRELKEWQNKFRGNDDLKQLLPTIKIYGRMLLTLGAKLDLISNRQAASSRSFDYNGIFFVIGVQFPEMGVLAPSFGVRKINMNKETGALTLDNNGIRLHCRRCRVITFSPFEPNLTISGGEDKKVTMHTIGARVGSKTWDMPGIRDSYVLSACWLTPTSFAVGCAGGRVYEYDIEQEDSRPVRDITRGEGVTPIIFLAFVPQNNVLLACSAQKLVAYQYDAAYTLLHPSETIRTIAWDHSTLSFMITFKTTPIFHKLYKLEIEDTAIYCNEMNEWKTSYNLSTTMWNNCLFTLKPYGTFSVIYNEDEKKLEAHDWTGNRAPVVAPFEFPENACDMRVIPNQKGGKTIVVLTENHLFSFNFNLSV